MNPSVLIVVPDPLLREDIKRAVAGFLEKEGHEAVIDGAGSVKEARGKIDKRRNGEGYDLLICHVHIPEDSKTAINTEENRGLVLLQELEKEGLQMPGILIGLDFALFGQVQRLKQAGLVLGGTETMNEELAVLCRRFLFESVPAPPGGGTVPAAPVKQGKLDLILKPSKGGCSYIMEGVGFKFRTIPEPLQIDIDEIKDLINRSRNVGEIKDWKTELQTIGKKILKELFEKNKGFDEHFRELVKEVTGEQNIRIRFIVDEGIYPLALEAVLDERGDHLMLHSPLFRSVYENMPKQQSDEILFVDRIAERPPINCLIIAADTWGDVEDPKINRGVKLRFKRLAEVMQEAQDLHDFLKNNDKKFKIERVQIVAAKPGSDFGEDLRAALTDNTWHLIHYAGHSYFDAPANTGYFFYPGKTRPVPVKSDVFSHTLRFRNKTQFIYLSSCQSSGADFVLGLARQLIPAIVGFRWEIDDEQAAKHAKLFYEKLFKENKPLPYAFLETRKAMYVEYNDNRIWAAGMLIIQGG